MTSRSRRKVPLGISRPWRVVGIIRFEQRGFDFSTPSASYQSFCSVHLLFNNLSTSIFRLLVSDHRSHYSTRVLHTYRQDTYRQVGEQKSPWIRGRKSGSSTGNITFVTTIDTFRVFALHNIHSFASDRNELSRDAWWLRILKESACIWLDNNQHVFVRPSNVIVVRVSERVSYRLHFVFISRPAMKTRIEKFQTRNLRTRGLYLRIDTTNEFRLVRDSWIFLFPVRSPCITPSSHIRGIILICIRWAVPLGYVYPNFVCIQDGFLCQWKYGC